MRLAVHGDNRLGVVVGDELVDVTHALPWPHDPDPLTAGWWRRLCRDLRQARDGLQAAADTGQRRPLDQVRLRAPALNPSKIVACASNYSDHVREMHEVQTRTLGRVESWMMDFDVSSRRRRRSPDRPARHTYATGAILYSPHSPVETLFILKRGRVRVFRVAADGRALTTAIITPGTNFGEMVLLGRRMYDSFAEALETSVVCVVSRPDVGRFLLGDPRIAARITEILGRRLAEMERRLSDSVFKTVPQRIAATLTTLAGQQRRAVIGPRTSQVALAHEQLAALVGTFRETATKVLGDFADRGLLRLARGRITVLDPAGITTEAGD